jgi:hypothetical protein
MKKFAVITMVIVMLALSAVPAFAKGPQGTGQVNGSCGGGIQAGIGIRTPYALSGTIFSLDTEAQTVTVTIACGNRLAQPFIGQNVTLQTSTNTRFLLRNSDGSVTPITFADLAVGQKISSHGSLVNGTWTAVRVTVGALLECQQ